MAEPAGGKGYGTSFQVTVFFQVTTVPVKMVPVEMVPVEMVPVEMVPVKMVI